MSTSGKFSRVESAGFDCECKLVTVDEVAYTSHQPVGAERPQMSFQIADALTHFRIPAFL